MYKFILKHRDILMVILLGLIVSWPIFQPGYFSHHDDLQLMRIFEMRSCLLDLQIPCRWSPDMGYGNGFPLYNYYSPAPYFIGALLSFAVGYLISAKILFLIPLVLGGVTTFYLGKELFGRLGGLAVAVLYLFAPYRAVDSFVRGAVAESFAMSLAPLILLFSLRLIKTGGVGNLLGLAFSLAWVITSHNVMTLIFLPVLIAWSVVIYWQQRRHLKELMIGILLGLGLSTFFFLPAYLEKGLVNVESLTFLELDFRAHFVNLRQIFIDRSFGYGASLYGDNDQLSFQVGWPHWLIAVISSWFIVFSLWKKRSIQYSVFSIQTLLVVLFFVSVFMMHIRSAFIWERLPILHFAQFPWRFLALAILATSLLGGYLISFIRPKYQKIALIVIIISTIALNFNYFKPERFYQTSDSEKLTGAEWERQQKAAILDYLPKTAAEPIEPAPSEPIVLDGDLQISDWQKRSNYFFFRGNVGKTVQIEVPVFDFPNWRIYANNQIINHGHDNHLGRIEFQLEPGEYWVLGKLENTPIRTIANIISLLSLLVVVLILINRKV